MKINTLHKLSVVCKQLKKEGKTTGLITGCFDILHFGHLSYFRFAKRKVDILIVGLENDKSISLLKGKERPIFSENIRAEMLVELESVDYVFIIQDVYNFGTEKADEIQKRILNKLKPSYLISHTIADKYWMKKKKIAKELGIGFIAQKSQKLSASSDIAQKLKSEL